MSIYRSIHVSYWQDSFILKLTPEQKFFYLYLMTNSKTTQCGIYEISKQIMCFETGYNSETIDKLLKIFIDYGKIKYCEETDEVFIINWLKHNPSKSPKVMACIKAEILKIKCKEFRDELINKLKNFGEIDTELYRTANKAEISKTTAFKVFERDKNKCVRCGATDDLTIDHIFPRKMGGTNALTNLRVLCRSCNSKRITSGTGFLEDLKKDGLTLDDFDRLTNPSDTVSKTNDTVSKTNDTVSKTSDTVSKSCRNNNNNNNNNNKNKNKNKNNNKKNIYNNQENSSSVVKTTTPSNTETENTENENPKLEIPLDEEDYKKPVKLLYRKLIENFDIKKSSNWYKGQIGIAQKLIPKYSIDEICSVINWAFNNDFWCKAFNSLAQFENALQAMKGDEKHGKYNRIDKPIDEYYDEPEYRELLDRSKQKLGILPKVPS